MQITPEIELPDLYEPFPEDLAALCHSNMRGMKSMTVHRMIQRGQYKIVASAQIQEKPTRNSQPPYTSEEICETAMQIIAHDIMETDDPGNYKVSFIGLGGRGRKIVSKHIRMREEQSPRAVNTMDEGDLLETQMSYIGELHQVNMGLMEVVSGMIRPLLEENKEMMKICTESVKRVGEVEALRMTHDLELRKMEDENRLEILKEQQNQEKWNELFEHVKKTGAMESKTLRRSAGHLRLRSVYARLDLSPRRKKSSAACRQSEGQQACSAQMLTRSLSPLPRRPNKSISLKNRVPLKLQPNPKSLRI